MTVNTGLPRSAPTRAESAPRPAYFRTARAHLDRATTRLAWLVCGDAAVVLVLAVLLGFIPDSWVEGAGIADASDLLPTSGLSPGQTVLGVLLCLILLHAYGPLGSRRSTERRLVGAGLGRRPAVLELPLE